MSDELNLNWFDLKNYEAAKDFTLLDWYSQLSKRISIYSFDEDNSYLILDKLLTQQVLDAPDKAEELIEKQMQTDWNKIKKEGIISLIVLDDDVTPAIRSVRVGDLLNKLIHVNKLDHIVQYLIHFSSIFNTDIDTDEDTVVDREIYKIYHQPIEASTLNDELLVINYTAPEKILMEKFRQQIRERKKSLKGKTQKLFSDADLESWVELKILPCMDLIIHMKLSGCIITHDKMGQILFPNEYDVALSERVRRSVITKVEFLLIPETLQAMKCQLAS